MISRRQTMRQLLASGIGSAALWHSQAFATVLMDLPQVQKSLFPSANQFVPQTVSLDPAHLTELQHLTGIVPPHGFGPKVWAAATAGKRLGWLITDQVIGKFELIDYAAAFAPDGSQTGLEIMTYRESHGAEVRNPAWRRQFVGRTGPGQLHFGEDIRNISGATLSCQHLTEGAQRLSALVQLQLLNAAGT